MPELNNRDYLLLRAYQGGITDANELAGFMGQMQVESGNFRSMHEGLNYSAGRLLEVFPGRNGLNTLDDARTVVQGGPEATANRVYGGNWGRDNLGNTEPGDGWNFHGRGYVQLTGRDNYTRDGNALDLDLAGNPDLAANREIAADIALHYWDSRVVARGHQLNVREATHDINGGYNHLPERRTAVAEWERILTPEVMQDLARGEVTLPSAPGQTNAMADGVLRKGEKGDAIRDLQQNLYELGYTDRNGQPLTADGDFGANTQHAVRAYQRDQGLDVDGIAGPKTLESIEQQRQQQEQSQSQASPAARDAMSSLDRMLSGEIDPAARQRWDQQVATQRQSLEREQQEAQQQAEQQAGLAR